MPLVAINVGTLLLEAGGGGIGFPLAAGGGGIPPLIAGAGGIDCVGGDA